MFLQGFDEYMNLVLDEAEEVSVKFKSRKALGELNDGRLNKSGLAKPQRTACLLIYTLTSPACHGWMAHTLTSAAHDVGRILLKGDNITLMQTT